MSYSGCSLSGSVAFLLCSSVMQTWCNSSCFVSAGSILEWSQVTAIAVALYQKMILYSEGWGYYCPCIISCIKYQEWWEFLPWRNHLCTTRNHLFGHDFSSYPCYPLTSTIFPCKLHNAVCQLYNSLVPSQLSKLQIIVRFDFNKNITKNLNLLQQSIGGDRNWKIESCCAPSIIVNHHHKLAQSNVHDIQI